MENDCVTDRPAGPMRRRFIVAAASAAAGGLTASARASTDYPTRPLRIVIPFPPGGPTDIVGRIVGQALSERLRQPIAIENRPGASGMIGADAVAKSAPDGHVLLINVSAHVVNPSLYAKMPHDPLEDFTPVTNLASTPIQLVVRADSGIRSVGDLVALVQSQPGRHTFASSSKGAPGHLSGELFKSLAKLDAIHVPYKGSAPALTDLMGGQVTYMFDSMPSSIGLVRDRKLRALGVSSPRRVAFLPDVPTFAEAGFPDLNLSTWYGMWGPARMSGDLAERLHTEVAAVLARPDVAKRLADAMLEPIGDAPAQFAAFCAAEARRYAAIVRAAGIRAE